MFLTNNTYTSYNLNIYCKGIYLEREKEFAEAIFKAKLAEYFTIKPYGNIGKSIKIITLNLLINIMKRNTNVFDE